MVILDTMIYVNAIWEESKYRNECLKLLKSTHIILPLNIVLEVYNVLKRLKYKRAKEYVNFLISNYQVYTPTKEDYLTAMNIAEKCNLKIFDSLILAECLNNNFVLITFDKKLRKIYLKLIGKDKI